MKYTPTPWSPEAPNYGIRSADKHILFANLDLPVDERKANSALIAAAPELLEALKLALKALDAIGDEMTVGERYTNAGQYLIDALNPCRDAIAKAGGTA